MKPVFLIISIFVIAAAIALGSFFAYHAVEEPLPPIPECIENWSCSDWSVCVGGQQVRFCKDLNACSTDDDKPLTSRACNLNLPPPPPPPVIPPPPGTQPPPPPPASGKAPSAPINLTIISSDTTRISLKWTDTSANEDGFVLQKKIGTGSFANLIILGPGAIAWNDFSVAANQTYKYRVQAFNSFGS